LIAATTVALRLFFGQFLGSTEGPFLRPDLPPAGCRAQQPSTMAGTLRAKLVLRL
jgi:hypothetical protein